MLRRRMSPQNAESYPAFDHVAEIPHGDVKPPHAIVRLRRASAEMLMMCVNPFGRAGGVAVWVAGRFD